MEFVLKIHEVLGHIGRQKLCEVILRQFWHPALDKVAREICRACKYCQMNKTNVLEHKPPVLKIQAQHPFELIAMDVVKLPTSKRGHIGLLTVIDHCSKWLIAVPIKSKSSQTIANALKRQVFPNLVRVPERILSDNGTEFRGQETEQVLQSYNIDHIYASPYCPQSNGAIERINQTILALLKALTGEVSDWDLNLSKAIVTYNSTYHSQIKSSPAEYIMNNSHSVSNQILIPSELK